MLHRTSIWAAAVVLLQAVTPAHAALIQPINGAVSLSSSTYNVSAPATSVALSAQRLGGTSGVYSVTYNTVNVSAKAPKEFTASTGTLTWGDGDASSKTFSIPVNSAAVKGQKSFFVRLTAGSNTLLGAHTSATVNIGGGNGNASGSTGNIGLTTGTYAVNATAGSVTLAATRDSGDKGTASVTYKTISQSAVAGQQFTSSTGTLTWADGDQADKSFTIPISKTAFSGTKSFWVRLAANSGTSLGAHTSATVTITGASAMPALTVSATPTTVSSGSAATLKWAATNAKTCAATGGWNASNLAAAGSQAVKNITKNTTFTMNCSNTAGSASKSTVVLVQSASNPPPTTPPPAAGAVSRPSYNTGDGFFVLNGKLYDPDGLEFRMRGVDRNHYDSNSAAGIAKSGANTVRMFVTTAYGKNWAGLEQIAQNDHVNNRQLVVPSIWLSSGNVQATCSSDTGALTAAVNDWVASASTWKALSRYSVINIANEWGPSGTVWRDAYIGAIQKLRAAGYTQPLMIDSGGCGQDKPDLLNYAADVYNADPQKNVIFSYHMYGGWPLWTGATAASFLQQLNSLSKSVGMAFVVGEFGPGRNIGPSPTLVTPGEVINGAEAADIGWIAWAWDDNNLGGCKANDSWFSMTYNCGQYASDSDLTIFGKDVVLNPVYGLQKLAKQPNW